MANIDADGSWMPLTLPQLDFWEEFMFHPDQPVSTVAHYIDLEGDLDEEALTLAITQTVREAHILSARFQSEAPDETPRQICDPDFLPELTLTDLRDQTDPVVSARELMERDLTAKLDLRHDKLSAHVLYQVGDTRYLWYIRAHHIIVDGYGLALIEQRCAQLYNHFCGASEAGLPFHSFASFLKEESQYQQSRRWQGDRTFWADFFTNGEGIEVLERGDEDYGDEGFHGLSSLPPQFGDRLRACAAAADLGWPDLLTLLSALYLFAKLPGARNDSTDSLTVWLPFMSRWGSVGAHLPALLVNILPFRMEVQSSEKLTDFLTRSAAELRQQRRHSRFRIEQISRDQGLPEGSRYFFSPLINVLPFNSPIFDGCTARRRILDSGPADGFNLTFRGEDDGSGLTLAVDADPSVTSKEEFDRHLNDIPNLLTCLLSPEGLERRVGDLIGVRRSAALLEAAAQRFPY